MKSSSGDIRDISDQMSVSEKIKKEEEYLHFSETKPDTHSHDRVPSRKTPTYLFPFDNTKKVEKRNRESR